MPHGTPDWGLVGPKKTIYGLDDLGEHAVRAGSPHLWDRRGDVVHITDFEEGLGVWRPGFWGAPAYVTLQTGFVRHGAYSVKLVTDGDPLHDTTLNARFAMPRVSGLGLEFSFCTTSQQLRWTWAFEWGIRLARYYARVSWDLVNDRLEYWDSTGAWHAFAENVYWLDLVSLTNTGKMVVDNANWQYMRFLLNNQTYDLAGIPVELGGGLANDYFQVIVSLLGKNLVEAEGYVDSIIVTQNEP